MDVGTLIALIISGLTFLISIGGGIYMVGKFTSRMETVEKRQVEDRTANEEEHREFRAVEKDSIALATKVDTLITNMTDVSNKIEKILERLPPRRRETDQED